MKQFLFELCLSLGGSRCVHPDELLKHLTPEQLRDWMAFHSINPIGDRRADIRTAVQTRHLRAAWVDEDEPASTFLPQFDAEPDEPETEAQVKQREMREADQFR